MKILVVVGRFPELSETFIVRKVVGLSKCGHQVTIAARDPGDWKPFEDYLPLFRNIRIQYLCPDTGLSRPSRLWRLFRISTKAMISHPFLTMSVISSVNKSSTNLRYFFKQCMRYIGFVGMKPDIIHFEFLGLPAMYELLPKLLGAPYVVSCRGTDLNLFQVLPQAQREAILNSINNAAAIHTVSENMKHAVEKASNRNHGVWINRPAVDTKSIKSKSPSISTTSPVILATGRLVWIKGFDYLLAALARLKAERIPFTAKIIGDGPLYAPLKFSIFDLGLEGIVELCGAVSPIQVTKYMQEASIFVLSSHQEGISNAVLEAMASGLPIVTTNAGGMAEAVRNGVEGFIVPVRDIDSLQNCIRQLLLDSDLCTQIGKRARYRAETKFDLHRQATLFEAMYTSVMNKKRSCDAK